MIISYNSLITSSIKYNRCWTIWSTPLISFSPISWINSIISFNIQIISVYIQNALISLKIINLHIAVHSVVEPTSFNYIIKLFTCSRTTCNNLFITRCRSKKYCTIIVGKSSIVSKTTIKNCLIRRGRKSSTSWNL